MTRMGWKGGEGIGIKKKNPGEQNLPKENIERRKKKDDGGRGVRGQKAASFKH